MTSKDVELKQEVDETTDHNAPSGEENEDMDTSYEESESQQDELEADQDENTEDEEQEDDIDYKAELEKAKREAENYKQGMLKYKSKAKQRLEDDTDYEDIAETVISRVKEEISGLKVDMTHNVIDEELARLSSNEDEKQLILHYYNTKIQQRGQTRKEIAEDLLDCKVLANKAKLLSRDEELKHVLKTRSTTQKTPNFSSQPVKKEIPSKLSPELKKFVNAFDRILEKGKKSY